nr:O-fucosyltransferase 8 isoform X2 [Ipomoea batatas]
MGKDNNTSEMQNGNDKKCLGRRVLSAGDLVHQGKLNGSKGVYSGRKRPLWWLFRHVRSIILTILLVGFLFLLDSLMFAISDSLHLTASSTQSEGGRIGLVNNKEERRPVRMYDRLLNMAASSLAEREFKQDALKLWQEPYPRAASKWKPCADRKSAEVKRNDTGYILVSANGGLNQQRVAVCNAVAVASLLNATLVIPKFLYSNVWQDPSQFEDIYEEEHFMETLKDEVSIVKDLPPHLKLLDLETAGSIVTDADLSKEATPDEYIKTVLPILLHNGVVHFLGFGNRLGFDPLPSHLQVFLSKLLSSYVIPHSFFTSDEVWLILLLTIISAEELRRSGRCPLTPEEAALVLASLGFKHETYIYLAGSGIYGGESRMQPLRTLYPNLVTKEDLLSPIELAPFRNYSSQLAALDFIACATADVFALTDSGSQLSSLVSGFRSYYGGGRAPTLRPSKKRLATILWENNTIGWSSFEERIRKMIDEGQKVRPRAFGRSIYRHPRCKHCMCKIQ